MAGCAVGKGDMKLLLTERGDVVHPKISFQPLRLSHPEIQDPLLAGWV